MLFDAIKLQQVIGLLDVFTPATSVGDFNEM